MARKEKEAKAAAAAGGERARDPDFDRFDQAAKKPKAADVVERTLFHGDAVLDYQGRTYMHAPTTEAAQQHKDGGGGHACYIPESCVHTWSGHTKGVSAIRYVCIRWVCVQCV